MVDHEHRMAKGTLYLMIAQIIFLGSGYIIHFGTARMVSPVEYGRFGVVLAILQILQIFLVKGIPDAVTKFISEGRDSKQTNRIALKIQGVFSVIIFLLLIIFSSFIANILNDDRLTIYIIVVSLIIPIRAMFSVFLGFLNGLREFKKVSYIINLNSVSRVVFVILFLFIGFGILGVIGGYICGSIITLFFCYYLSRSIVKGKHISSKEVINFSIPMILFSASYLVLMNLDIIFVKAFLNNPSNAGFYTAARMLSSIIFGIFMGLSFSLFPSISKSVAKKDIIQTRNYINHSIRYMLMIVVPICVIVSIYANGFLTFFYPVEYGLASTSLSILVFGTVFISIFVILGTIMNGAGKPKISMAVGGVLVVFYVISNYFLIKEYGMVGGAWATFIVGIIGIVISAILVYKEFKTLIKYLSFFRILAAGLSIAIIGFFVEFSGFLLISWSVLLLGVYIGILYLLKEISIDDFRILKNIFRM